MPSAPSSACISKAAHVHSVAMHCIVLEHKSEIDLWATIIDRFLTNMLKQMEELNAIETATEMTREAMAECDLNYTIDLFVWKP